MLRGSFGRKLNSAVDKDNIDSFRSFKKELDRTRNEHGDSIPKLQETKSDNAIGQIISNSDKTSAQGYYDSNDKDVGRDIPVEEDADIEFEQDNDSDEDNNYDAVEASDEREVYYEEIEQLETENEIAKGSQTDSSSEDFVVYGDEYFDGNVEEDNNYQNYNNKDTAFVQKGMTPDSEENGTTMSENVSEYPVAANNKHTSDENFTGNEEVEENNNVTKNAEGAIIAGLYESAKKAETYETAMYYLNLAEKHLESKPTDYFPETFLRQKLYYKFHKNKVMAVGCIFVLAFFAWLYIYGDTGRNQKMAELKAERERQAEYQRRREQEILREREIQQKIRERQEKARIQAAKEAAEKEARENANKPERIFMSFHQAITDGRLQDAYNILSPDYQRFVGSYEKFTPGYRTTISSEIVNLEKLSEDENNAAFSYRLKAVDRDGSGRKVQYFVGKAKLIKIENEWRLDGTEAKLINNGSSSQLPSQKSSIQTTNQSTPAKLVRSNPDGTFLLFVKAINERRIADAKKMLAPGVKDSQFFEFLVSKNIRIQELKKDFVPETTKAVYKFRAETKVDSSIFNLKGTIELVKIGNIWYLNNSKF